MQLFIENIEVPPREGKKRAANENRPGAGTVFGYFGKCFEKAGERKTSTNVESELRYCRDDLRFYLSKLACQYWCHNN